MKLVDLDQTIFSHVVDETHGSVTVEMQMTVGEFFGKFCKGFEPKTIDAIPVEWMKEQIAEAPDSLWASLIKSVMNQWQKEQEAQDG